MKLARSDARNDATSAISSGWAPRLMAWPPTTRGKRFAAPGPPDISVSTNPGQITFARMPTSAYSTAAALVNEITPALDAEYTLIGSDAAFSPPVDDQLTIAPPPVATIVRMACLVPRNTPRR